MTENCCDSEENTIGNISRQSHVQDGVSYTESSFLVVKLIHRMFCPHPYHARLSAISASAQGYFNWAPDRRARVLEPMKAARVAAFFCGHYHRNAGAWDLVAEQSEDASVDHSVDLAGALKEDESIALAVSSISDSGVSNANPVAKSAAHADESIAVLGKRKEHPDANDSSTSDSETVTAVSSEQPSQSAVSLSPPPPPPYFGLEVIVSAAVGVQLVGDPLPSSIDLPIALAAPAFIDASVSGLRIVSVTRHAVTHRWATFAQLEEEIAAQNAQP